MFLAMLFLEIESPQGMFNKENLTIDNIMKWDFETLNKKYNEVGEMKSQLGSINAQGQLTNARFKNYKQGDYNLFSAIKNLDTFDNKYQWLWIHCWVIV